MIKAKVTDLEFSKDEISKQNITSIFDNFETNERIYFQGDEPIFESEQGRSMISSEGSVLKNSLSTKKSFFSKLKAYICKILNIKTSNQTQNGKI